jgi:hypothetical protein
LQQGAGPADLAELPLASKPYFPRHQDDFQRDAARAKFARARRIFRASAADPPAPTNQIPTETHMEPGEQGDTRFGVSVRAAIATILIAGSLAAIAITGLLQTSGRATAQSGASAAPAPAAMLPRSDALDRAASGPFAFGYLEFDWNPSAPGGVPGFDSWPPGSRPR